MRKYYSPRNIRKRIATTPLPKKVEPWFILEVFVQASAGYYSWDTLCDLLSACRKRSVARYLQVATHLDDQSRLYTGQEDVEQVFVHRQTIALLKKYPFTSSDLAKSPREAAIEKWSASEAACKATNERIRAYSPEDIPSWVPLARLAVQDVLGELTPARVMQIIGMGKHGPGSTLSSHGNRLSAYYKFADLPYSVCRRATPYAYAAMSQDHKWIEFLESTGRRTRLPPNRHAHLQRELQIMSQCVEFEDSDKITFVPKDCRTDRPIAVGSSFNIYLQLGVKAYMQERLRSFGVDLTDQTRNQRYAMLGAKYSQIGGTVNERQFSTIDLASASDTISIEIVKLLLPPEWFAFLSDLRHASGSFEGTTIVYEKFSAMGNGFTFPLESLIFYAISKGVHEDHGWQFTPNDFAVYGDDIIVRFYTAPSVIDALVWAGFTVNDEKSYLSGPFKESCGEDYFLEHNVRPFYLKRELRTTGDIYHMCNWIQFKQLRNKFTRCLLPVYTALVSLIPQPLRAYGPMVEGTESHLAVTFSDMNEAGLRPFLSADERRALVQSKLLEESCEGLQSPFSAFTITKAVPYRALPRVQYMLWLRYLSLAPEEKSKWAIWCDDITQVAIGNQTYRRDVVKQVVGVAPVLQWDGQLSVLESRRSIGVIALNHH